MSLSLRPFYLISVFWGDEFRQLFAELCLPSLLAPGNIPALEGKQHSRLVICTTLEDWRALADLPIFVRLREVLATEFVELKAPVQSDAKYAVMSVGHQAAVRLALRAGAYGVFVSPDAMLSNGSLLHLQSLAKAGKTCVLAAALRFSTEPVLADLERRGLRRPGEPIVLEGRELVRLVLPHMHPETKGYDWDSQFFTHFPVCSFWRVRAANGDDAGIVLHSQSWGPVLLDYAALPAHDMTTLERWTLDGDYIYRNFGDDPRIHVVQDSDDLLYVSFTPEAERADPVRRNRSRGACVRVLTFGPLMDPLKRRLFRLPVRIHSQALDETWQTAERRAGTILAAELRPPSLLERAWVQYQIFGWRGFIRQSWRPSLRRVRRLLASP